MKRYTELHLHLFVRPVGQTPKDMQQSFLVGHDGVTSIERDDAFFYRVAGQRGSIEVPASSVKYAVPIAQEPEAQPSYNEAYKKTRESQLRKEKGR